MRHRTCSSRRGTVKLAVLTDSTANIGMCSRTGSGRVRHLGGRWLWAQEAAQGGQFALKRVGTAGNVSDLTTKYHDEERLEALMRMGGLRFTRGLQCAALVAKLVVGESWTVAANAIRRMQATELDHNLMRRRTT